jgi:hypothetical protein
MPVGLDFDLHEFLVHSFLAGRFLRHPRLQNFSVDDHALFVTEAKGPDQILDNHTAQAINEMYACAKHLG